MDGVCDGFYQKGDGIRLHVRQRANISVRLGQALAGNARLHRILSFESQSTSCQRKNNTTRMDGVIFMGWVMGFEPTHVGTTIRGLNRLATPTIYYFEKETIKSAE